ncbi:restriction endonuclease [Candidatus Peregrinibacteria bacterium CG10_big_fil_rev_8_21_14_0_10_42_8]|nr:MAG: restriction endonuclease [Candidatus Peregrinibacteria bacterium CG10_big_fil_rev_8_21_14_0_10_42_8]
MAIPQFKFVILPFLKAVSDGGTYTLPEVEQKLAQHFNLTEGELAETTPSGRMTIFTNRVGWSKTYLKKAGLIDAPTRQPIKITQLGLEVLNKNPEIIDRGFLMQFESFKDFSNGDNQNTTEKEETSSDETPEETLEAGYQSIQKDLREELLVNLKNSSPAFFEQSVLDLLLAMGYGGSRKDAVEAVGRSGDGGIDGVIKEDKLGLGLIYIQAKRWDSNSVGRPDVQSFVGALNGKFARKGIFITTSQFTQEATEYTKHLDCKVILIDGWTLAGLMIEYSVGVSVIATYHIKRIDTDYFTDMT